MFDLSSVSRRLVTTVLLVSPLLLALLSYRWRLSKMHFLYENSLTAHDFRGVVDQWTAASVVVGHLMARGLKARLAGEVAADELPARAEPSRATKPRSREVHAAPA